MRSLTALIVVALLATGCSLPFLERGPERAPAPVTGPEVGPRVEPRVEPKAPATPSQGAALGSPAVIQLAGNAHAALQAQRFDDAVQLLERAIRIDPRNGALWHRLAQVYFEEGNYEQAIQMATRSNALLPSGSSLQSRNNALMDSARTALRE